MVDTPPPASDKKPPPPAPQAPRTPDAQWRQQFDAQLQAPVEPRRGDGQPDDRTARPTDRPPEAGPRAAAPATDLRSTPEHAPETRAGARSLEGGQTAADRKEIHDVAEALLKARDDGLVRFSDDVMDRKTQEWRANGPTARWLESMANAPEGQDLPMNPDLAKVLDRMLSSAERRREAGAKGVDFTIVSLYRPDRGASPHRSGAAVDIGMYAGNRIHFMKGGESIAAVAQFYQDMLGGEDRPAVAAKMALGLPRNPRMDPAGALAEYNDAGHPEKKKYYDLKSYEVVPDRVPIPFRVVPELKSDYLFPDTFFHREQQPNRSPTGSLRTDVAALRPEARQAISPLAEQDGGRVLRFMLPDAFDHLHAQVLGK